MHHFDYRDGVLHAEAVNLVELAAVEGYFDCGSEAGASGGEVVQHVLLGGEWG